MKSAEEWTLMLKELIASGMVIDHHSMYRAFIQEIQREARAEGIEMAVKIVTEERHEYGEKLERAMGKEPYYEPRGTVHMWTAYYRCAREIKDKICALLPKKKS